MVLLYIISNIRILDSVPKEKPTPAEFLLSKIASDISDKNSKKFDVPMNTMAQKTKFTLILFLYPIIIIASAYSLNFYLEKQPLIVIIIPLLLIFLTSIKNKMLFSNFAPDLSRKYTKKLFFTMSQVIISYIIYTFVISILAIFMLYLSNNTYNVITIIIFLSIISLLNIYTLADLGFISLGLGIPIISFNAGVKNLFSNYKMMLNLRGTYSKQLALLRILLIGSIFYCVVNSFDMLIIPIFLIYTIYAYKLEKLNASQLMMSIRGYIQEIQPAFIPTMIVDENTDLTTNLSNPEPNAKLLYKDNSKIKPNTENKLKTELNQNTKEDSIKSDPDIKEMEKYAAKTISRIIEKVKDKPLSKKPMIRTCPACKADIMYNSKYCPHCGYDMQS